MAKNSETSPFGLLSSLLNRIGVLKIQFLIFCMLASIVLFVVAMIMPADDIVLKTIRVLLYVTAVGILIGGFWYGNNLPSEREREFEKEVDGILQDHETETRKRAA